MFNWKRQGLIFACDAEKFSWSKTHTALPTPVVIDKETIRIFYTTRDITQQSRISFIDVELENPVIVKYVHPRPILDLGDLGTFDDKGHTSSQIVEVSKDRYFLFLNGYNIGSPSRYRVGIGLAESSDLTVFKKPYKGPIIDRSIFSPCGAATPFIIFENGKYRMWYASFIKWEIIGNIPEPFYCIKYAESSNLFDWKFTMEPAIELASNEGGIVRPTVFKLNGRYHMHFSVRQSTEYRSGSNNSYRIGYAISDDGLVWKRADSDFGVPLAETGWDSAMMAYPYVLSVGNTLYMFYNGNGFGQSGFGLLTATN